MARRRDPPWGWILGVFAVVTVVAVGASFFSQAKGAPSDPGVCWRATFEGGRTNFHRLATDVLNLESCSAYLERIHLQDGGQVTGAFQGRFIFVDDDAIKSAASMEGSRWRVFFGPQRAALDRRLRAGSAIPTVVTAPAS